MEFQPLSTDEERIIVNKWTEPAFSWEYWNHHAEGTYVCRRCLTPLYHSKDKFNSGCGWPSFDDAIPGAIWWIPDSDGVRTEITCARCGGHLGHVFVGEEMTEKNTRHCVNSLSIKFVPEVVSQAWYEIIVLWWGCFRCVEAAFQWIEGIKDIKSWYSGGKRTFPTYEQVCTWATGHIEVVQLIYDPHQISLEKILKIFFIIHDPTSLDRQGHDEWSQYRSAIFTTTDQQKADVLNFIRHQQNEYPKPIVTQVLPLQRFRVAEGYHQNFFTSHPEKAYCQMVIKPKLDKLKSSNLIQ
jgi:peptide methionine sulfoxide reductase msrA/msrB